MGVSEKSVPLNPMVNDHYPYKMAIIGNIPYFQTNPCSRSREAIRTSIPHGSGLDPGLIRQGAAGDLHEGQTREDRQGLPLINKQMVQEDAPPISPEIGGVKLCKASKYGWFYYCFTKINGDLNCQNVLMKQAVKEP